MNLPLAQLICGMPPPITPSHAPSINQHIADNTLLLPFLQPINQYTKDAAAHKPTPGSSTHQPSSLHHQMKCLQAINNSIQQFNQQLKAEKLDRQILQLVVLQLQNDFAVLRYLLFPRLGQSPTRMLPLKTLLLVLYLILTLTLTLMLTLTLTLTLTLALTFLPLFRSPALKHRHFAVLPRWALWGQPKQKQTTLQTTIPNPYPTRKKLRYRTSHQEFANWKNCLPMKYQRTHQSLQGSILNTFYYTIKFASLNLATQMLLFGKSLSEVCFRLCKGSPIIIRSTHRASYKF